MPRGSRALSGVGLGPLTGIFSGIILCYIKYFTETVRAP